MEPLDGRLLSDGFDLEWEQDPKDETGDPDEDDLTEAVGELRQVRVPSLVQVEEGIWRQEL